MGVWHRAKSNRLTIKTFGFLAFVALVLVLMIAPLLSFSPPTSAQTGSVLPTPSHPEQLAQAQSAKPAIASDAVLDWNLIAQTVVAASPAPEQYRVLAITHAAVFDAVNAIAQRYTPYAIDLKAPTGSTPEAAAITAAQTVLVHFYPAQKATLDAALTTSLAKVTEGQAKTDGIALGKTVAEKLLALRSHDGADQKSDYKIENKVGVWQPTPPLFASALLPHWSSVTPFVIQRADQFKVPEPLPLNSAAYVQDLNEVKRIGGQNSAVRTADQTAAAIFSPISPVVLWNTAAQAAAKAHRNSLLDNARLLALLNLAGADAYIAGYEVKYKYKLWRPATAIPNADALNNPAITADRTWRPLIVTPPHPDYISGHCVTAGAEQQILQHFFGNDALQVSIIFPANVGITRTYTSFSQIADELGESRIWGGVHTRTADVQGGALGKQVGDYVFAQALRPKA